MVRIKAIEGVKTMNAAEKIKEKQKRLFLKWARRDKARKTCNKLGMPGQ